MVKFTEKELKKVYNILKALDEGLLENPSQDWEMDYYDEPLIHNKGIKPILRKIQKALPKELHNEVEKKVLVRRYDTFNNQIDDKVYRTVNKAFNDKLRLDIEYFSMSKEKAISRKVDIYAKNSKYMVGFCRLRQAIRKFRLSRIVSAKLTDKTYRIPFNFNKRDYL